MAPKAPHSRAWRKWTLRCIGPVLLALILIRVDLRQVFGIIASADFPRLGLVVALCFPLFYLRSLRWRQLLLSEGIVIKPLLAFRVYMAANFFGAVTPGHLGEFIKVWYVKRYTSMSKSRSMASVLTDRLMDLWVIFILGFVGMWWLNLLDRLSAITLVAAALVALAPLLTLHAGVVRWGVGLMFRFTFLKRFTNEAERMQQEFTEGVLQLVKPRLLLGILFTILAYGIYFVQCEDIAFAIDVPLDFWVLGMIIPITIFVTMLPISPAGLGTREAAIIYLFGLQAVGQEAALSFSLLMFVVFNLAMGLIGYAFWLSLPQPDRLTAAAIFTGDDP